VRKSKLTYEPETLNLFLMLLVLVNRSYGASAVLGLKSLARLVEIGACVSWNGS
jgi:hypothetical protein